jgi:hypothetical protein
MYWMGAEVSMAAGWAALITIVVDPLGLNCLGAPFPPPQLTRVPSSKSFAWSNSMIPGDVTIVHWFSFTAVFAEKVVSRTSALL